jgi:enterochelin esterase-like enzyme
MMSHAQQERWLGAIGLIALVLISGPRAQSRGPIDPTGTSPRITQLKRDIASGAPGVADRFWTTLSREHAPIIEPVPGDPTHVLVTLVWRGTKDTAAVHAGAMDLQPIANTDIWYFTFTMASNHRFWYAFKPEPAADGDTTAAGGVADPLNPHRFMPPMPPERPASAIDPQSPYMNSSILVLPDTPTSPWVDPQPGVPTGTVEERTYDSEIYGSSRRVWVYTPPTAAGPSAGLLICLWGPNYLNEIPVPTIIDNLLNQHRIPPLTVLFIDNTGDRFQNIQSTARFTSSLSTELLPWAQRTLHAPIDARHVIVTGYSAAGLASAYIAYKHPDQVGNVLAQSGAFWRAFEGEGASEYEWISRQFASTAKRDTAFYLDVGGSETLVAPGGGPIFKEAVAHLRDVLTTKGYAVQFDEVPGGEHEYMHWRSKFADGLLFLTSRW